MSSLDLESRLVGNPADFLEYVVMANGYSFTVERYDDWITALLWNLPDGLTFQDFADAAEKAYEAANQNGYSADEQTGIIVESSKFDSELETSFDRPLTIGDIESLGITLDQMDSIQIGHLDLADFIFDSQTKEVVVIFEERPHQLKAAFKFMYELFPRPIKLQASEVGRFILSLERRDQLSQTA